MSLSWDYDVAQYNWLLHWKKDRPDLMITDPQNKIKTLESQMTRAWQSLNIHCTHLPACNCQLPPHHILNSSQGNDAVPSQKNVPIKHALSISYLSLFPINPSLSQWTQPLQFSLLRK